MIADSRNNGSVTCNLILKSYTPQDTLQEIWGPSINLEPGREGLIEWRVPDQEGAPIAEVGLGITSLEHADGILYLDYLTWEGAPDVVLSRPVSGGAMWRRAWVDGKARLVKVLDGEKILDEADFSWEFYKPTRICLQVEGNHLRGWLNEELIFDRRDNEPLLYGGGIALVCEEGCMSSGPVQIRPVPE